MDGPPLDGTHWVLHVGDPTLLGWVSVAFYAWACILCLLAWRAAGGGVKAAPFPRRNGQDIGTHRRAQTWLVLAIALLCLGVNKQLDLQILLIEWLKDAVWHLGLYPHRRVIGRSLAVTAAILIAVFLWQIWRRKMVSRVSSADWAMWSAPAKQVIVGAAMLGVYVVIRALTFGHVDEWVPGVSARDVPTFAVLEIGALIVIIHGAWRWRRAQHG